MTSVVRDFVEGIGITPFEELPTNPLFFTQIAVQETVELPEAKPDIEQLLSVMVDVEIISKRLIKTPVSKSFEGQILTGYKLILELKLKQKIKYVADEPTQSVHAAHFEKLLSSVFIIVPQNIGGIPIETLLKEGRLLITPYVEDIYAALIGCRKIFKNIVLLIDIKAI